MFFKFLKRMTSQIKCDKKLTDNYNWVFLGGKMQKLKFGKSIFVDEDQICFLRCKDKTCDMLKQGNHKICEEALPLLFKRLNIKEITNKIKLKTDVYYYKTCFIYNLTFKKQYVLKKVKIKEKISTIVNLEISDLELHTKYIFLEDAVVDSREYNKIITYLIESFIEHLISQYNGDLIDLTEQETLNIFKIKLEQELFRYGLSVTQLEFKDYRDLTKYQKQKKSHKQAKTEQQKETLVENKKGKNADVVIVDYRDYPNNKTTNINQYVNIVENNITSSTKESSFNSVVTSGRIIVNPDE